MKTLLLALFSFVSLGLVATQAQDYSALPFAVSLGGQAATYNKGEPFAKVAKAVKNDAAIEVTATGNPIIINVAKTNAKGEPAPGCFAGYHPVTRHEQRLARRHDGQAKARRGRLHVERGGRGQDGDDSLQGRVNAARGCTEGRAPARSPISTLLR